MKQGTTLNDKEHACLKVLAEYYHSDEENCLYFRTIEKATKLDRAAVRRAVRALARKGLAELHRGLFHDDGTVAGSGYCATKTGAALISPCDVCGALAVYDYEGKRECEQHRGMSRKATQAALLP